MADAILAHSAKILMGDGATPQTFAEIGKLGDFEFNDSQELIDVTSHDSGGRKEYIADVIDADEVSFTVKYDNTNPTHNSETGLRGKLGEIVTFRVEFPGDTKGTEFRGVVISVGRSAPVSGGALEMSITIKPTGAKTEYDI